MTLMRMFTFIMLLAITLSGYSSAVHAMPKASAHKSGVEMTGLFDCCASSSDHGNTQDNDDENTNDGKGKACHGCCLTYFNLQHPVAVHESFFAFLRLSPPAIETHTTEHSFSLLRPPRILV